MNEFLESPYVVSYNVAFQNLSKKWRQKDNCTVAEEFYGKKMGAKKNGPEFSF
jgi:hypothetical protein